jgi:agmatinase
MPFAGIATFAGYPLWQSGQQTDAVVLGIPYDEGTTYRPGARFGPRAIRDASMFYSYEKQKDRFYDADRRKRILCGKSVADAGDVQIQPLCLERNWAAITRAVTAIRDSRAIPAIFGGDHSITYPVIRAFEGQTFHYVHFDTHVDCDQIFESSFTHGTPVLHILKEELAESITIIGVRGLTNSPHDVLWIQEQGINIITARELRNKLLRPIPDLFGEGNYYLSLDIDFFDPSAAPGTGTPEPGGLFFPDFSDVVHLIGSRGQIIGFDVVEVNPLLDGRSAVTAHLAARCALELMSAALDKDPQ